MTGRLYISHQSPLRCSSTMDSILHTKARPFLVMNIGYKIGRLFVIGELPDVNAAVQTAVLPEILQTIC